MTRTSLFGAVTINDDFTDRKTDILSLCARPDVDLVLAQETKHTDLRAELDDRRVHGWAVRQSIANQAIAGTAIAARRDRFKITKTGRRLAVEPRGAIMLPRYLTWSRVTLDDITPGWVATTHRPPGRYAWLWPAYDAAVAARIRAVPRDRWVIVGIDANHPNPQRLARMAGCRWVAPKDSIDGFLIRGPIEVASIRRLPQRNSDHHPVLLRARITATRK